MSAPVKPWESDHYLGNRQQQPSQLNSHSSASTVLNTPVGRMRMQPPLPPRPNAGNSGIATNSYNNYNSYGMYNRGSYGYGSPYNSYGSYGGMMGSYGGYGGSYGGLGSGYGNYGGYGNPYGAESRFIQMAEASTRPAFQNIESLVRAFSGISMMLDSTFFAITSSFRAVLGIAENFGRLRSLFSQVWSSFALVRLLNWIYKKVLIALRLRRATDFSGGNQAWQQAAEGTASAMLTESNQHGASWPIFLFLGIILSAPYLFSRMIPSLDDRSDPSKWPNGGIRVPVAHQFTASTPQELTITPGEMITIAPKEIQEEMQLMRTGWVYASSQRGVGIVPYNYLNIRNRPKTDQAPVNTQQPILEVPIPDEPITGADIESYIE